MKRTRDDLEKEEAVIDDSISDAESDGGDSDGSADDDGIVAPYDAFTQESLPESPVYTEAFSKVRQSIQELVNLLRGPILDGEYRSGVIEGLLEEVNQRTKGGFPEKICIALIGEMAAGKSSVINSILSVGIIARQGDGCRSCTWVTQEFCHTLPRQTMSYAAEVYFFTEEERHQIVKSLVADYYHAFAKDDDDYNAEPKDSDQATEDFAIMKTTTDAFRALFSDRREFSTVKKAHEFLQQAQAPDDKSIVNMLCLWTDELMSSILKRQDHVFAEASTTQSLLFDIAKYCYTVEQRDGLQPACPWPFVSFVKFGLDNRLLMHGISLLDVPGLSDTNKTRVANALKHLGRCTHGIVVAEISRAADEGFIRTHLTKGFLERGSGRTMLVLTHADELNEGSEVKMTAKEKARLTELREEESRLDELVTKQMKKMKGLRGTKKYAQMAKKEAIEDTYRKAEAATQEFLISLRSQGIVEELQNTYAELTPDPLPLPVFCVGNKAYKKHQAGYKTSDSHPPTVSVSATNIPKLREHMFLVPAEGVVNETRHLVSTQLPTLLSCFQLFVSKTHMDRKGEIEAIVLKPKDVFPGLLDSIFEKLYAEITTHILEPFMEEEDEWAVAARDLCRGWARAYPRNHLAFLKTQGCKRGKGKGAVGISWNNELLEINQAQIRDFFSDFLQALGGYPKEVVKVLANMATSMMAEIRKDDHVTLMALKPFLDYVYHEKANIGKYVEQMFRTLRRDVGLLTGKAINEGPENYLCKAMTDVYDTAAKIKGKAGTPKQRVARFEAEVTKLSGVWLRAHDGTDKDFKIVLKHHLEALKTSMLEFFEGIHDKFNMLCSGKEVEDEAENELRHKLQKNLVLAQEMLENEIRPHLDACLLKKT